MTTKVIKKYLGGVLLIEPDMFKDERGFFMETYHLKKYKECGIDSIFVQDNHSHSKRSILRGLHYQLHRPQGKLVYVLSGEIYDVAVDIRHGSPTFGQWAGIHLSGKNKRQLFVPAGFAHGFCVLSETADVIYKCTDFYASDDEGGILWSDSTLSIDWPAKTPILSKKDSQNPSLDKIPKHHLPVYNE